MRVKFLIMCSFLMLAILPAYCQSAVWVSFVGAPGPTCDVPATNKTVLCVVNGSDLQVSSNGSPLVSLKGKDGANGKDGKDGAQGVAGVAGAKGDKGDPGATGAQGPAGTATLNNKVCSMKITGINQDGSWAVVLTCP